jgi:hypothetical protein
VYRSLKDLYKEAKDSKAPRAVDVDDTRLSVLPPSVVFTDDGGEERSAPLDAAMVNFPG